RPPLGLELANQGFGVVSTALGHACSIPNAFSYDGDPYANQAHSLEPGPCLTASPLPPSASSCSESSGGCWSTGTTITTPSTACATCAGSVPAPTVRATRSRAGPFSRCPIPRSP